MADADCEQDRVTIPELRRASRSHACQGMLNSTGIEYFVVDHDRGDATNLVECTPVNKGLALTCLHGIAPSNVCPVRCLPDIQPMRHPDSLSWLRLEPAGFNPA